jgi:erythromycin esterase-like protein
MLQNLEAFFASDYEGGPGKFIAARDLQMFVNLKFLQSRLPKGTKIIVWTANAHAANGADESNGFAGVRNLGSYVFEEFGRRGFALGTTAFAGSQRWGRERKALPDAPVGSLEALAFSGGVTGSVYYDQRALRRLGPVAAAPFGHRYAKADWWRRFDGLVVFREEHAAFSSRYGN